MNVCLYCRLVSVEWKLCSKHPLLRWIWEYRSRCRHRREGEMGRVSRDLQYWGCEIHRWKFLGWGLVDSWEWRTLWCRFMKQNGCVVLWGGIDFQKMDNKLLIKYRKMKLSCSLCWVLSRVHKLLYFRLPLSTVCIPFVDGTKEL